MSRLLPATLLGFLLALPVSAQIHGSHAFGGGAHAGGPSVSFHASGGFGTHRGGVFARPGGGYGHGHGPYGYRTYGHGPYGYRNYGYRAYHHYRPFLSYGYYGAYGYPYLAYYPYDFYYSGSAYGYSVDSNDRRYEQLSNDVSNLSSEMRDLRDRNAQLQYELDRQSVERQAPPPEPLASAVSKPSAEPTKTVLVFRDGRRQEVANYAIAGQTLWILSEQSAKRVPLSELNLEQTKQQNAERGLDFSYSAK
jgi:hypothetical protein